METNVSDAGDVRVVRGDEEKSCGDVQPTPSSGGESIFKRPEVEGSMETRYRMKDMRFVTHGCAVVRTKSRRQHWVYIDKKKSFGWKYQQTTKLICRGLIRNCEIEIGCSSSDIKSGDFGLAEGGLASAQNNEVLKSESFDRETLLVARDDVVSCKQTCQ